MKRSQSEQNNKIITNNKPQLATPELRFSNTILKKSISDTKNYNDE